MQGRERLELIIYINFLSVSDILSKRVDKWPNVIAMTCFSIKVEIIFFSLCKLIMSRF